MRVISVTTPRVTVCMLMANLVLTIQKNTRKIKKSSRHEKMYLVKHPGTGSVSLMGANVQGWTRPVCHFPTVGFWVWIAKLRRAVDIPQRINLMNPAKSGQMARLLLFLARGSLPRPYKALRAPF